MKKLTAILTIAIILLSTTQFSFAQDRDEKILLSGNLFSDSKLLLSTDDMNNSSIQLVQANKKSPFLAGLLSFAVPGAGEFYAESYLKAGIFLAIEAAVITTAIIYDNKGDDQTASFEKFANENWSVRRYAEWTLNNLSNLNGSLNASDYNVLNQNGTVNWVELNRLERDIGSGYSHSLAPYGDQQYYEMIGKYPQFSHGWSDANQADTDYHILSPYYLYYSGERGKANDFYNVASKAVIGIYVNHFLSILDAVWTTANYNKDLSVKFRLEQNNLVREIDFIPTMHVSYSF
ncbi:MAG: hypothetical protein IPM56_10025 [Ignavibacteriales bacterium]|nr:MAG: hypothetical protein IPM56_10025 [Ignavibacteriales bacterium]